MIFNPVKKQNQVMAFQAEKNGFQIVYGTQHLKISDLKTVFPNFQFCFIRQVHGNHIAQATIQKPPPKADGHWTTKLNHALVVQTADCLPIFLMSGSVISAVHAGWKGVVQNIVSKAIDRFPLSLHDQIEISIGPHISEKHFIVDEDVVDQLAHCTLNGRKWVQEIQCKKYTVALAQLVKAQIFSKINAPRIYMFDKDTFSSKIFHSYRRTSEKNVGQYSFIVRTECLNQEPLRVAI